MKLTSPKAWLLVKLEFSIVPLVPNQYTAPALWLALLFSNVEFEILPLVAPSYQSIAPPLTPAVLFSKWELANVLLLHSALPSTPRKYTAPPLLVALLFIKLQSST